MKRITVKWSDSNLYNHQTTPKEEKYDYEIITTTGYLVEDRTGALVIAREYMSNGDVRGVIVIPKVNIIKRAPTT